MIRQNRDRLQQRNPANCRLWKRTGRKKSRRKNYEANRKEKKRKKDNRRKKRERKKRKEERQKLGKKGKDLTSEYNVRVSRVSYVVCNQLYVLYSEGRDFSKWEREGTGVLHIVYNENTS